VRIDSGVEAGSDIPDIYDPMVAKLIVRDVDRETARRRMIRALDEYVIEGPRTLIPFHRWLLEQEEFIAGGACHAMLAELSERATPIPALGRAGVPTGEEAPGAPERVERRFVAEVGGKRFDVRLFMSDDGLPAQQAPAPRRRRRERSPDGHPGGGGGSGDTIASPMQGTVLRVLVEPGAEVAAGDVIVIVEAMKMENEVSAHRAGIVRELAVAEGQAVQADQVIAVLG
jgi:acetyl-CoA/propionyl-CoA carboxylase biotin carboxyl carrier protein